MKKKIEISDELMAEVQKLSHTKSKKAILERALQLSAAIENQKKLLDLWGKVDVDDYAFN